MRRRSRTWLRTFLHLDARAASDGIPLRDIERQEDTINRALEMLDSQPGVVLADEVGMGKTYEALGIAAAIKNAHPHAKIVVVTPGPDLNKKWQEEFSRFREMFNFGKDIVACEGLTEFVKVQRSPKGTICLVPVTMFRGGRKRRDQLYLLSLYCYWKRFHGNTANALIRRFDESATRIADLRQNKFLEEFDLLGFSNVDSYLQSAFRRRSSSETAGLDDLYETSGLVAFENKDAVTKALYRARFELTQRLIRTIDLLIVDEAHKLKNPGSITTQAVMSIFDRRFERALFLTATPFQLDVGELGQVFALFTRAKRASPHLKTSIKILLQDVREYQRKYEEFQSTWVSLDPDSVAEFHSSFNSGNLQLETIQDPVLRTVAEQFASLKDLKHRKIEPGFRQWMIRSLREEKRTYRETLHRPIHAEGAEILPFLLYERFIAELFRQGRRTHKAAAEINMVSSFSAAKQGTLLSTSDNIPVEAEAYWHLLRQILEDLQHNASHPKSTDVIQDSIRAAERNEKTLIFCSRVATLSQLRRELDALWEMHVLERWRYVYPDAGESEIYDTLDDSSRRKHGRHSLLRDRFHRPHDALYLALREPYLRTLDPRTHLEPSRRTIVDWVLRRLPLVVSEANRILSTVRVGKTSAERRDYQLAKRCVEQAALRKFEEDQRTSLDGYEGLQNLLHPDYLRFGLDLSDDEFEAISIGNERPKWRVNDDLARLVLGNAESLWCNLSVELNELSPRNLKSQELRVRVVEQLARYLTYKQVTFLPDLLTAAHDAGLRVESVESAALLEYADFFWSSASGQQWRKKLQSFLVYFSNRNSEQQLSILDGSIRTINFTRDTADGESRQRLREAFNTPLYPMVLIANEVMQEGLDLHKNCRRVVHHDLVWNPAQIEQRIGRVDRLGSLVSRLREQDRAATLSVRYPTICDTIDERLFRTVKTREKWLEFLLGASPDFSEYTYDELEPSPLPDQLAKDLVIDLGPQ